MAIYLKDRVLELELKMIAMLINIANTHFKQLPLEKLLEDLNKIVEHPNRNITTLKTLKKYLSLLEKDIKVITKLHTTNIDSKFANYYRLNFSLDEVALKIEDYFSKKN
ncbi:plasmid maintenance protein (plasmid) [Borreliella yangtzensis]|uniref:plasmid maintenance protein n=1 Tax=Borreliella yangtzensis TaxID=683292 RepID=UPI003B6847B5